MKCVEEIVVVCPYRLTLRFNTGEVRVVDMEATLRAKGSSPRSAHGRLLDPATFCSVRLDRDGRTVCWDDLAIEIGPDGIERPAPLDYCPDFLYELSAPLAQSVVERTGEGLKSTKASAFILKDEPPRPA